MSPTAHEPHGAREPTASCSAHGADLTLSEGYHALTTGAASWTANGLGQFEVAGADAHAFVNRIATADLSLLVPGRFVHSLLLRDDASILDRVTIYRFPERVMLLVDASQRAGGVGTHRGAQARQRAAARYLRRHGRHRRARPRRPWPAWHNCWCRRPPSRATSSRRGSAGIDVFAARATLDGPEGLDLYCRLRDLPALQAALLNAGVCPMTRRRLADLAPRVGDSHCRHRDRSGRHAGGSRTRVAGGRRKGRALSRARPPWRRAGRPGRSSGWWAFMSPATSVPPLASRVTVAGVMVDRVRSIVQSPRVGVIGMTAVPTTADVPATRLTMISGEKVWKATVMRRPFVSRALT